MSIALNENDNFYSENGEEIELRLLSSLIA